MLQPPSLKKRACVVGFRCVVYTLGAVWCGVLIVYFMYVLDKDSEINTDVADASTKAHAGKKQYIIPREKKTPSNFSRANGDESKRWHMSEHSSSFDRSSCPYEGPPENYPPEFPIMDVISNWNPDDTTIPPKHFASLCRFHYQSELSAAKAYREAEVPFIVYGVPSHLALAQERWANASYLVKRFGSRRYLTEASANNHFMYFSGGGRGAPKGWTPPVENTQNSFGEWLAFALAQDNTTAESPHRYFRTHSMESSWIAQDLAVLTPRGDKEHLLVVDHRAAKGIHCRFGMRGVVAAAHFDGSRNVVCVMGGHRRYMLAKPRNCEFLHLYPKAHPSGRHSEVDWSAPSEETNRKYPDFQRATVNEVILEAGDFLYLPSGWIHYIMSLNINWQCNARSGKSVGQLSDLAACNF